MKLLSKKNKRIISFIFTFVVFLGVFAAEMPGVEACHKKQVKEPKVYIQGYIPGLGWTDVNQDGSVGMIDQGGYLKAFKVGIMDSPYEGGVHALIIGVEGKLYDGKLSRHSIDSPCGIMSDMCGVIDKPDPLSQVSFDLTGEIGEHYDIVYRVYAKNEGWTDWVKDGYASCGDKYQFIEAINVKLVPKETEEETNHKHYHWFFRWFR
ncbi:MAG: hypothetical protein IKS48_12500 [Eubacterium sp.]|nr:hypothetical protein [Eubacterium sp.]